MANSVSWLANMVVLSSLPVALRLLIISFGFGYAKWLYEAPCTDLINFQQVKVSILLCIINAVVNLLCSVFNRCHHIKTLPAWKPPSPASAPAHPVSSTSKRDTSQSGNDFVKRVVFRTNHSVNIATRRREPILF